MEVEEIVIDGVFPENNNDHHLSSIDKSSVQQYKLSLHRCSNAASSILLEDVWQKHFEIFDGRGIDHISESVSSLLQNREIDKGTTWKSSLSNFEDPLALFENNLLNCDQCNSNTTEHNINKLLENSCKCDLGLNANNKQPLFVKTLAGIDLSGETKSDENSTVFKPRFGKKAKFNTSKSVTDQSPQEFVEKDVEEENRAHKANVAKITFKTAREQFLASNPGAKRTLGASRKAQGKFVSPMIGAMDKEETSEQVISDERLKHIDLKMIELIESEIIDKGTPIGWDDIAGLQLAKSVIQEAVVWPLLRPDIFTGLRRPPRGVLLFGPPGTGKTLIGKCIAAQCNATFFSISASSLTSKWIGDGEKMVRALFAVARCHMPAVIFIDEIDSLLSARSDCEHEATRRIKTEFLVQFDGAATSDEDRLLIVGATNRPQELDEAARRRLVKRLYIPLPDDEARKQIISNLLSNERHGLSAGDVAALGAQTAGYSGADMRSLCAEAAMGPIRSVPLEQISSIRSDSVRPVSVEDFLNALKRVRPSVSQDDLGQYVKWNNTYGQGF